jgi:hypothetical protein
MSAPTRPEARESFVRRWLAPADRLAEAIYGLLILMTFTMAFQATTNGEAVVPVLATLEVRGTIVAAIGCAVAWALIDGVMYLVTCLVERGERVRVARAVQRAPSADAAIGLIAAELDGNLAPLASADERRALYERIYERARDMSLTPLALERGDLYGALATVLVAIVVTLPAVAPFFILADAPLLALRVSNGIAILMLFLIGWSWAREVGARSIATGAALALLGVLMVVVAIPLGG